MWFTKIANLYQLYKITNSCIYCIMQAVIICGGKGIRLRSVIGNNPKALVKLGGKENLINIINNLKKKN